MLAKLEECGPAVVVPWLEEPTVEEPAPYTPGLEEPPKVLEVVLEPEW